MPKAENKPQIQNAVRPNPEGILSPKVMRGKKGDTKGVKTNERGCKLRHGKLREVGRGQEMET